jgi:uncharacterized protein YdeI (YjbR/CyaY-like superfamily)
MENYELNPKVDAYFSRVKNWKEEQEQLRWIILDCGLTEELKWGAPCYTYQKSNIVLIHAFKDYCAVLFFKGALLNDPYQILIRQTENVQSARQVRFTNLRQVVKLKQKLQAYVYEAIEVEKAGLKVEFKDKSKLVFPEEFQNILKKNAALKAAFNALTPGRQRAYNLYFTAPKLSRTREARVEKSIKQILKGKGLND